MTGDQETASASRLPHFRLACGPSRTKSYEEWRDATAPLFEARIEGSDGPEGFDGHLEGYNLGRMIIGFGRSVGQRFRRDRRLIARSPLDHFVVQLYTSGGSCGTAGRHDLDLQVGDISIRDLSQPYATTDPDFANITLVIPRTTLAPLVRDPDGLHGLTLSHRLPLGRLLGNHLHALVQAAPRMTAEEALAIDRSTASLIAACVGAAAPLEQANETLQLAVLDRIRRYVDANLASPALTADAVCRHFGVSRSTLYRLFKPMEGFAAHVRRRRLDRAFIDLTAPQQDQQRIADICDRYGFASDAAFSRAFRQAFGVGPSDVRRLAPESLFQASSATGSAPLPAWLNALGARPAR